MDSHPGEKWRPPRRSRPSRPVAQHGLYGHRHRSTRHFHHYYYRSQPRVYIYGGWGAGWYDPWWWGNYYWPVARPERSITIHHYYDRYVEVPVRETVYYRDAPWVGPELHTALTDVAVAWSTGDIELLQAHLTPGVGIALQYDWEQDRSWVLAAPVLLDLMLETYDAQVESRFRFVQVEEMEPGLIWAVAEHDFTLEGEGPRQATMEFMFREYENNAWLVEAIVADPENYWWMDADLLDDAERESARLFDEMEATRAAG